MPSRLKTGKIQAGSNQVRKAIKAGTAKIVYIALDAEKKLTLPIRDLCIECGVELVDVDTMKQLGDACSVNVPTAAAVLL